MLNVVEYFSSGIFTSTVLSMRTSLLCIQSPNTDSCVREPISWNQRLLCVYVRRWPFRIIWSIRNSFQSCHCFAHKIDNFVESNKRIQTRSNGNSAYYASFVIYHLLLCVFFYYFVVFFVFIVLRPFALDADSIFRMSVNKYCAVRQCQVNAQHEQQWALVLYK